MNHFYEYYLNQNELLYENKLYIIYSFIMLFIKTGSFTQDIKLY